MNPKALIAITMVLLVCLARQAEALTVFYFTSSPTSWVGHGQTAAFTDVSASRTYDLGVYTDSVHFDAGGYDFTLVGPGLTLPTVGFYPNATRWPFMGSGPGMDFYGQGRDDNTLTGWFNVLQADYDATGQVAAFAVDFVQYDEGVQSSWNLGSIRYNSSIPVPEPSAGSICCIATVIVSFYLRRRNKAFV